MQRFDKGGATMKRNLSVVVVKVDTCEKSNEVSIYCFIVSFQGHQGCRLPVDGCDL